MDIELHETTSLPLMGAPRVSLHPHARARTHTHTLEHIYIYIYIYVCVCVCVCVYICVNIYPTKETTQTRLGIIIIIISSCYLHRFPWLSLAIRLYHLSLTEALPGNIQYCQYRGVVVKFELAVLCVHPCSSSSVSHVLFVKFGWSSR